MLGKRETPFRILYAFNRKDKEFMDKLFILYLFRFLKFFSFDGTVVAKNILVQND